MGKAPDGQDLVRAPFQTTYALLSVPLRRHRLSLRYERFLTRDQDALSALDPTRRTATRGRPVTPSSPRCASGWRSSWCTWRRSARRGAARGLQPLARETLFQASWRIAF
jgi:hypothetical protein